jgi:zona occludens toxin
MALNGYFGKPGSGKSYSVVEYVIIPALTKGRHVVTNIPLESELLEQVYGGKVTQLPLDALDNPDLPELIPHGAVAVVDECWRRWPSGQKVSAASKTDLQWLKEHRHRVDADGNAMQVVLVTQNPADLASWVRNLIAHSFHMYKLDTVGAAGRFGIKVYQGCPYGDRIPQKLIIREAFGTYKPEIYQYYKSATQSESLDVGDERAMDKRTNIWGSGQMIAIGLFILLAIPTGVYSMNHFLGMADRAAEKQGSTVARPERLQAPPLPALPANPTAIMQAAPAQVAPVADSAPRPSPVWRIVGYIKRKDPDAPADPVSWPSITGYNLPAAERVAGESWQQDQVILQSLAGMRTVSLSACKRYENSYDYYCDLDGERVTPWTGQQALSQQIGNVPMQQARGALDSQQSEESSAQLAGESQNPAPETSL